MNYQILIGIVCIITLWMAIGFENMIAVLMSIILSKLIFIGI